MSRRTWAKRLAEKRAVHPKAYDRWTPQDIERLKRLANSKLTIDEIAHELGRQPSAIESRLWKLIPRSWGP